MNDYFTERDAIEYPFYRVPKALITDSKYRRLDRRQAAVRASAGPYGSFREEALVGRAWPRLSLLHDRVHTGRPVLLQGEGL